MLCSVNRSRVISVHILSLLRVTNQRYRDPVSSRRQPLLCCGAMAPKRKADQPETPDTEKKPRAKAAKKSPATEPYSTDDGWTVVPPSLLFKDAGLKPAKKIAAFDLDGTLIGTKGQARFPTSEDDWKFFNKNVPKELQHFHEQGFKIVIFSNQNGVKSALEGKMAQKVKGRITNALKEAGVTAQILCATGQDQYRKPESGMFDYFVEHGNGGQKPDMQHSFFVGDAAGRPGDFADSDKQFAANAGLPFKTPEEVFGEGTAKKTAPTLAEGGENHNQAMSAAFLALAEVFEAKGGNSMFASRANKKTAGIVAAYPKKIEAGKELKSIAGIGKGSQDKIDEFIKTGTLAALTEADNAVEGGDADKKGEAVESKAKVAGKDMAMKFL